MSESKMTAEDFKLLKRSYKTLWNALQKIKKPWPKRSQTFAYMYNKQVETAAKALNKAELQLYRVRDL